VAVHRTASGFVAVTDACPHMGASLADATLLDENTLECHWHHWKFDTTNGRNTGLKPGPASPCTRSRSTRRTSSSSVRPLGSKPEPEPEDEEWMTWDPERFFRKRDGES
jgi:nitrite reductase/ring-hydroxylating ferredoxin subunit